MSVVLELSPELEAALTQQARVEGVTPEVYLRTILERELQGEQADKPFNTSYGALADLGTAPSLEEIAENRREMMGSWPHSLESKCEP